MHIKDYLTHPKNIELKGILDEKPEKTYWGSLGKPTINIRNILKSNSKQHN